MTYTQIFIANIGLAGPFPSRDAEGITGRRRHGGRKGLASSRERFDSSLPGDNFSRVQQCVKFRSGILSTCKVASGF